MVSSVVHHILKDQLKISGETFRFRNLGAESKSPCRSPLLLCPPKPPCWVQRGFLHPLLHLPPHAHVVQALFLSSSGLVRVFPLSPLPSSSKASQDTEPSVFLCRALSRFPGRTGRSSRQPRLSYLRTTRRPFARLRLQFLGGSGLLLGRRGRRASGRPPRGMGRGKEAKLATLPRKNPSSRRLPRWQEATRRGRGVFFSPSTFLDKPGKEEAEAAPPLRPGAAASASPLAARGGEISGKTQNKKAKSACGRCAPVLR